LDIKRGDEEWEGAKLVVKRLKKEGGSSPKRSSCLARSTTPERVSTKAEKFGRL